MGTADVQGPLWSIRAREWAAYQEPFLLPGYAAVFDRAGVGPGTVLLDIGCGAGLAAQIAASRGARVAGIDASAGSLEIARERVPAGDFRLGDMEQLPWEDHTFDVVTGFNSFQFAGDPVAALREARRVTSPNGRVAVLVWGREEECEHAAVMAAMANLLPPSPSGRPGPFALSQPGQVESLLERAGLTPADHGKVNCPFEYPDAETACRALTSSGLAMMIIRQAGEERLRQVILEAIEPHRLESGGYREENVFRYVIATV